MIRPATVPAGPRALRMRPGHGRRCGGRTGSQVRQGTQEAEDEARYLERVALVEVHPDVTGLLAGEALDRYASAADAGGAAA